MKNKGNNVPLHVAIIPDGNRRWAKSRGLAGIDGHKKSATYDNLKGLMDEAKNLGIKYFSLWGFSTENWDRKKNEIRFLFSLMEKLLIKTGKDLIDNKIRFRHLGRKDRLPKRLVDLIRGLEKRTEKFTDFNLQLCLDYGGRDEIIRAVNKMLSGNTGKIDEKTFSLFLDSAGIPDVDLIIRTSGEKRVSGFMPFQSVYAEFYFADKHFPDFTPLDLHIAVENFSNRVRRFGGD